MRLRTLLLGSAAAVLAVGAATVPAKAADPVVGAVVLGAPTVGSYINRCDGNDTNATDDDGLELEGWCVSLDWSNFAWSTRFGNEVTWGATPAGNVFGPIGIGPGGWSGFSGSGAAPTLYMTRRTDSGWTVEVRVDAFGQDPRLRLTMPGGPRLEFTTDGFGVRFPVLGGNLETVFTQGGGGLPTIHTAFTPEFGPVEMRIALLLDPAPYAMTWLGADATVEAGPAEIKVGAWRTPTAFGVGGQVELEDIGGGPFSVVVGGNWSNGAPTPSSSCSNLYNSCGYGAIPAYERYHYATVAGTYWAMFTQAQYESDMGTTRLRFSLNQGPVVNDRTMDATLRHTLDLGDTPVDLYGEVGMERGWNPGVGAMDNAFGFRVGLTTALP